VDTWKYRASTIRIFQNQNLLIEAKLTAAGMEFSPEVFQQLDGLRVMRTDSKDRNAVPSPVLPQYRILSRSVPTAAKLIHGYSQTQIWVDQHGLVTRAEVQDADDPQIAAVALQVAQHSVYAPLRENGQPAPFNTAIFTYFAPPPQGTQ
jgi:hypothetical protein